MKIEYPPFFLPVENKVAEKIGTRKQERSTGGDCKDKGGGSARDGDNESDCRAFAKVLKMFQKESPLV